MGRYVPAAKNIAPHFTDPRRLPKILTANGAVAKYANSSIAVAQFWVAVGISGAYTNTDFSADTYKTIVSTTGAGYVSAIIGPSMTNNSDTTTFRITVDGTAYTITVDAYNAGDRAALGFVAGGGYYTTADQWNSPYDFGADTGDLGILRLGSTSGLSQFWPVPHLLVNGAGMLAYSRSLVVEIKETTAQTGTANVERRAGVIYLPIGGI